MNNRRLNLLVFVVLAFPFIMAVAVLLFGDKWFPAGDMAQAELHMRGFFHRPPLVGAAGRIVSDEGFQGSHPGPSLWFAMLPVYLLGGRSSAALLAAAASVHVVSIGFVLFLAKRRFGSGFPLVLGFTILAVIRSSGPDFMVEPWNPWLALLPFAVFVFLIMDLVESRSGGTFPDRPMSAKRTLLELSAAVLVGSHCVQSHAGYVLLVVPPLAVVLILSMVRSSRGTGFSERQPKTLSILLPALVAVSSALLIWSPAVLDQVRRKPGNLTILWQHFGSPSEPTLGVSRSLEILFEQLNLLGPWLLGPNVVLSDALKWIGFLGFVLLMAGALYVVTFRLRNRLLMSSLGTLLVFIALGSLSILRIFGPYYEYTVRWLWILTAITVAMSGWILHRSFTALSVSKKITSVVNRRTVSGLIVIAASLTMWQVVVDVKLPGRTDSRIISGLIDDVTQELDNEKTYQIRFYDPYTLNATGFGLLLELERRGFNVKVDPEFAAAALPHRTAPSGDTDAILWVVVGPALERARTDPALHLIAAFNPRSAEQQERADDLLVAVAEGLKAAGRQDLVASLDTPGASILFAEPPLPRETADLVRELISMGQPTGVFSMSIGDVATSLE